MSFLDPIKEAKAVAALRESLAAVDADDEQLLIDSIDGETSFLELVDALLLRRAENEALVKGVNIAIAELEGRKTRFQIRAAKDRTLIEQAMSIAELKTLERPIATLTMANRPASLLITEESEIPASYWKSPAPTLDRKALTVALNERAKAIAALPDDPTEREAALAALPPEIPGATLSNGAPSLTIRSQ